jgi:ABC-2 type transport system ATP-binding protein
MDTPFLKIKNIIKKYGSRLVLNNISLDIYKGEIISLLGVNGAGKTTLSSIIATLFPPTDGDIEFEGKSIYRDVVSYRFNIGFCQQKPNLTPALTLEQNLRLAGSYYNMPEQLIEKRLNELADQLDLHPYLKENAHVLSGGFKQRFMIARSLMHNPKLLLLDEPTVALDPHIRRQLWTKIKELKSSGVTVILTTHYLDEAEQLSDRVCVLNKGVIQLIDTPDKLKIDFKMKNLEDVFIALMEENPLNPGKNS